MAQRVGRTGWAWVNARKRVLAGARVCHLCGLDLDFDAPPRTKWAPSVDHIISINQTRHMDEASRARLALDPTNLRPAHFGCNSRRGDGHRPAPRKASRRW